MDILPDIKLGPVTDREDAHRFAFGFARIVQPPQFGTLALRVPAVIGRTEGKDTLLGAALLFIAPRAAQGSVNAVFVERLLQALGLPHVRAIGRAPVYTPVTHAPHVSPLLLVKKKHHK